MANTRPAAPAPQNQPTNEATPLPTARRRRVTPLRLLGCFGLLLLVLALLALSLPSLAGGRAAAYARDAFAERFQGSLEIEAMELAWFAEQNVEGVVVRDPAGLEVARARATLPSLWSLAKSGGERIGRVRVDVDAQLVADDQGETNLARALAPREPTRDEPRNASGDASEFDLADFLARLELDLEVHAKRLSWSDAETRRLGSDFEVRDLALVAHAQPHNPLTVKVDGRIQGEQPGTLALDVALKGPLTRGAAWPFASTDAQVRVTGFSSAMVDGLANLHGDLRELLGPHFDLRVDVVGATLTQGEIDVTLSGGPTSIAFHATLADGVLRSGDKPGLLATLPLPRGFLRTYVESKLPGDARLELVDAGAPWTIRAPRFELPMPKDGAFDVAALQPLLDAAQLELTVDLPGRFVWHQGGAANTAAPALSATRVDVRLAAGAPVALRFDAELDTGVAGRLRVDAHARAPWTILAGTFPQIELDAALENVGTAALDAFLGPDRWLSETLGPRLDVVAKASALDLEGGRFTLDVKSRQLAVDVRVALADGRITSSGDEGVTLRFEPDAAWAAKVARLALPEGTALAFDGGAILVEARELNVPVPRGGVLAQELASTVARLRVSAPGLRVRAADDTETAMNGLALDADVSTGGALKLHAGAQLAGRASGKFVLDASTADLWRALGPNGARDAAPVDLELRLSEIETATLDALLAGDGRLQRLLGARAHVVVALHQASLAGGRIVLDARSPQLELAGELELANGVLTSKGAEGVRLALTIPESSLVPELAPYLPEGMQLGFPDQRLGVVVSVSKLALPLPDLASPAPDAFAPATLLPRLTLESSVRITGADVVDERTRASGVRPSLRDFVLELTLAPGAPALAKFDAALRASTEGKLHGEVRVRDPFARLTDAAAPLVIETSRIEVAGLDTTMLDAFSGEAGLASGLLGRELGLTLDVSTQGDDARLKVAARSSNLTLDVAGAWDGTTFSIAGEQALALSLKVDPTFFAERTASSLPAGTRLSVTADATPLVVTVRELRLTLPGENDPARPLAALAQVALQLNATLPTLSYADAQTDAAQRSVQVEGLTLEAALAPREKVDVSLKGRVRDEPPGELQARITTFDTLETLANAASFASLRVALQVRAQNLPTAIVDVLAAQDGLLVEALGERVELTVDAPDLSLDRGAFQADFRSALHSVQVKGRMQDRSVIIEQTDGLLARFGLGPIVNEKVVGSLLPMLFDVAKPEGATPAMLAIDRLSMPFDGDLSKLDATIRLDMGEVDYRLIPGLSSFFKELQPTRNTRLPALEIPIVKGVARYDRLPLQIGGKAFVFKGTYSLVDGEMSLGTDVPLSILGSKVSKELEKVREYVSPDLLVPLEIRGTWKSPRLSVGKDFVEKVVKDAAKKGLEGLLDGFGKKKN